MCLSLPLPPPPTDRPTDRPQRLLSFAYPDIARYGAVAPGEYQVGVTDVRTGSEQLFAFACDANSVNAGVKARIEALVRMQAGR